jgi:hypothetical protein
MTLVCELVLGDYAYHFEDLAAWIKPISCIRLIHHPLTFTTYSTRKGLGLYALTTYSTRKRLSVNASRPAVQCDSRLTNARLD